MKIRAALSVAAIALAALGLSSVGAGALAAGQTITFGEDPNAGLAQYDAIGVSFGAGPCCIEAGNSNGDPGNWGLEGTNDPYFLGVNGSPDYAFDIELDEVVSTASVDAARSNGSTDGTVTLEALLDGVVVDSDSAVLGAINEWSSLTVTGPLDELRITGTGSSFHPFGIDNLVLGAAAASNQPPVADAGADQTVELGASGVEVALDGSGSVDPDGDSLTYTWTGPFQGGTAEGVSPTVVFAAAGTYTVTLTVDDGDLTATDTVEIVVAGADATTTTTSAPPAPGGAQPVVAQPRYTG